MAGLVEQPLALVNVSVVVEIAIGEPFRTIALWDLAGRQLAVMIFVILRESLRKFRNLASLVLIAVNFPTADKYAITVDNRHGLELPRHAAHPPQFLARFDSVRCPPARRRLARSRQRKRRHWRRL